MSSRGRARMAATRRSHSRSSSTPPSISHAAPRVLNGSPPPRDAGSAARPVARAALRPLSCAGTADGLGLAPTAAGRLLPDGRERAGAGERERRRGSGSTIGAAVSTTSTATGERFSRCTPVPPSQPPSAAWRKTERRRVTRTCGQASGSTPPCRSSPSTDCPAASSSTPPASRGGPATSASAPSSSEKSIRMPTCAAPPCAPMGAASPTIRNWIAERRAERRLGANPLSTFFSLAEEGITLEPRASRGMCTPKWLSAGNGGSMGRCEPEAAIGASSASAGGAGEPASLERGRRAGDGMAARGEACTALGGASLSERGMGARCGAPAFSAPTETPEAAEARKWARCDGGDEAPEARKPLVTPRRHGEGDSEPRRDPRRADERRERTR
mmetsp:Transcript_21006/g.68082  ORF Transcript_21006/g.68082 Transcript_21006/m.68082 type:complete len:387 (-) Transcript_21006:854-2014(-)|eukprot:scaffold1519_cov99-Isochrysis_galbana.AAC.5